MSAVVIQLNARSARTGNARRNAIQKSARSATEMERAYQVVTKVNAAKMGPVFLSVVQPIATTRNARAVNVNRSVKRINAKLVTGMEPALFATMTPAKYARAENVSINAIPKNAKLVMQTAIASPPAIPINVAKTAYARMAVTQHAISRVVRRMGNVSPSATRNSA